MTRPDGDCHNDDAEAMDICEARKGTRVLLYDTGEIDTVGTEKNKDDFVEILVKRSIPRDQCEFIETFEEDMETSYLRVDYTSDSRAGRMDNLDGKVSGLIRDVPGYYHFCHLCTLLHCCKNL